MIEYFIDCLFLNILQSNQLILYISLISLPHVPTTQIQRKQRLQSSQNQQTQRRPLPLQTHPQKTRISTDRRTRRDHLIGMQTLTNPF